MFLRSPVFLSRFDAILISRKTGPSYILSHKHARPHPTLHLVYALVGTFAVCGIIWVCAKPLANNGVCNLWQYLPSSTRLTSRFCRRLLPRADICLYRRHDCKYLTHVRWNTRNDTRIRTTFSAHAQVQYMRMRRWRISTATLLLPTILRFSKVVSDLVENKIGHDTRQTLAVLLRPYLRRCCDRKTSRISEGKYFWLIKNHPP